MAGMAGIKTFMASVAFTPFKGNRLHIGRQEWGKSGIK
jgi:hypothetical protein